MKLFHRLRNVYFFGYGADSEPSLIKAVTGRKPKVIGKAILHDHSLRIQKLHEIKDTGPSPQAILKKAWGSGFRSYVIVPQVGAKVAGTLFKISLHDRHLIDNWEMVDIGWYDKVFVEVILARNGRVYSTETQVLGIHQNAETVANGTDYTPWLQPKSQFMNNAARLRALTN